MVGHGLATEQRFVAGDESRVVDQDQRGLAAHVDAGVVVPVVLRRDDAIADEDDLAAGDRGLGLHAARADHHVVAVGERHAARAPAERQVRRRGRDLHQRHVLAEAATGGRLQAELQELLLEVLHGPLLARRARRTALEFVRGQARQVGAVRGLVERGSGFLERLVGSLAAGERDARPGGCDEQDPEGSGGVHHAYPRECGGELSRRMKASSTGRRAPGRATWPPAPASARVGRAAAR